MHYNTDRSILNQKNDKLLIDSGSALQIFCGMTVRCVGLFTIANYRKCAALAVYVISDVYRENDWNLGWRENKLDTAVAQIIDTMIAAVKKQEGKNCGI